jgi:2-dehydropantoate 2-reductase
VKIVVLGAGSIGCFIGGALLAAGGDVILVGRARMQARVLQHGLLLTDTSGAAVTLAPGSVPFSIDPSVLADADLVLVTVKSADTDAAADLIARHARADALVLSLQNGVGNVDRLRSGGAAAEAGATTTPSNASPASARPTVLAGMVPFNVVQLDGGRLHRGTAGEVMVEASARLVPWLPLFAAARLPLQQQDDFTSVQWGKLLINLNNAINALSGIPLQQQFSQRGYRRCLAALIDEGRTVLEAAGIRPAKVVKLGPRILPLVLRLPDAVFRRVAAPMLRIDPEARSSMWEDLEAGRRTEVDYLNGAIVTLARSLGRNAPCNARMVELIRAAEQGARTPVGGAALYRMLTA